jgi:hypothetical protein
MCFFEHRSFGRFVRADLVDFIMDKGFLGLIDKRIGGTCVVVRASEDMKAVIRAINSMQQDCIVVSVL